MIVLKYRGILSLDCTGVNFVHVNGALGYPYDLVGALLNRKFHTSQISHHVKNRYQYVTFANVKFMYGQFR